MQDSGLSWEYGLHVHILMGTIRRERGQEISKRWTGTVKVGGSFEEKDEMATVTISTK